MTPDTPQPPPNQPGPPDGAHGFDAGAGIVIPWQAIQTSAVRSSGPGGQNVNRRATKVELRVHINDIPLNDDARERLLRLAGTRITQHGELIIVAQTGRTQPENKRRCLDELARLVTRARRKPKVRRPTKPTKASKRRRLDAKKQRGQIKKTRRPPNEDPG